VSIEALKALARKEFLDLVRDPRIFIPFLLSAVIMPAMGLVLSVAMQTAIRQAVEVPKVAVADLDGTELSRELVRWLSNKAKVVEVNGSGLEALARSAAEAEAPLLLVVEPGFGRAVELGRRPSLIVIGVVWGPALFPPQASGLVDYVKEFVARKLLGGRISYELVKDPVALDNRLYLAAKGLMLSRPELIGGITMAAMLLPLILLSIAATVMSMAATSMAVENEERTLETLLSLPVSSYSILLSKLLGMFALSLLGTVFEVVGMVSYFYLILSAPLAFQARGQPLSLQVAVAPADVAFIAASLLVSLFFAAAVGLIIGALSRDVRIANTLTAPLSLLLFLPTLFVIFAPSQGGAALLYSLPITQPVVAARDAVAARLPAEAPLYLAISVALTLAMVYLASKLFSLETLSTLQYKLSSLLSRRVSRGEGEV